MCLKPLVGNFLNASAFPTSQSVAKKMTEMPQQEGVTSLQDQLEGKDGTGRKVACEETNIAMVPSKKGQENDEKHKTETKSPWLALCVNFLHSGSSV